VRRLFRRGTPVASLWKRRPRNSHATKTYDALLWLWYYRAGCERNWREGLQTLVLEAGRPIDPDTDYANMCRSGSEIPRYGRPQTSGSKSACPTNLRRMDEWNSKFFVDDKQNPYSAEPANRFCGFAPPGGGRSIIWDGSRTAGVIWILRRTCASIGVDWPIRYQEIAPWYDYVENFIGVSDRRKASPPSRWKILAADGTELRELVFKTRSQIFPGERIMTIAELPF